MKSNVRPLRVLVFTLIFALGALALGSAETTKITFMTWESPKMNQLILDTFKEFEAQNPGITVKLVPSPLRDYSTKVKQMLLAGEAPDVFMVGNDMGLSLGSQGVLFDWTKFVAADPAYLQGFYPGVVENWKVNGSYFGIPALLNTYGVFYNKKLLKAAGVSEPQNGWTVDEFLAAARKLAVKSGPDKHFGAYFGNGANMDPFFFSTFAVAAGGAPWADGITRITKVSADSVFKAAVQKFVDAIKDGAVMTPSTDTSSVMSLFKQGRVPLVVAGQWNADDLIRTGGALEWGFVANPSGKGNLASTIFDSVGWASAAGVKNPEAAYKLIKFITTTTYKSVLSATPVAPAAYVAASAPYFAKLKEAGHPEVALAVEAMSNSPNKEVVRFQEAWGPKASRFLDSEWNNILQGTTPVSKLDDVVAKINKVIPVAR